MNQTPHPTRSLHPALSLLLLLSMTLGCVPKVHQESPLLRDELKRHYHIGVSPPITPQGHPIPFADTVGDDLVIALRGEHPSWLTGGGLSARRISLAAPFDSVARLPSADPPKLRAYAAQERLTAIAQPVVNMTLVMTRVSERAVEIEAEIWGELRVLSVVGVILARQPWRRRTLQRINLSGDWPTKDQPVTLTTSADQAGTRWRDIRPLIQKGATLTRTHWPYQLLPRWNTEAAQSLPDGIPEAMGANLPILYEILSELRSPLSAELAVWMAISYAGYRHYKGFPEVVSFSGGRGPIRPRGAPAR